jgi:hypothetical protein
MRSDVTVGSLVSFVTVDRGIDIDTPSGTLTTSMSDRLNASRVYYPKPGETGLVVAGPEKSYENHFKVWHVLVNGSMWWFVDDELVVLDNPR